MRQIFSWVEVCVVSTALLTASCATDEAVTVPGPIQSTVVVAQPSAILPQFVADPFCHFSMPFFAVVDVTVTSRTDLFLQSVQFALVDGFGVRAVPLVSPIPFTGIRTPIPNSTPIPLPGLPTVSIPGQMSFTGQSIVIVSGQPRTDSFSLGFNCGAPAAGTLSVVVASTNRQGAVDVSRTTVHVGA